MAVWSMYNDLNCHTCTEELKRVRGCQDDLGNRPLEGFIINHCPLSYATWQSFCFIQAYAEYSKGFLPNEGGYLSQPIKFSQAVKVIDSLMQRWEEDGRNKSFYKNTPKK